MEIVHPAAARYATDHTTGPDATVAALRAETEATMPAPQMAGGRVEVKLLEALVVATRARRVLEIGTFTGVGALSMASRLEGDARLVTIEADADHAAVARRHIAGSPQADRIELLEGDALALLDELEGPFDLVFVDAWKTDYPAYYEAVVPKLAPHGILVADNMLRGGTVLSEPAPDESAAALRAVADRAMADPRVDCALLTVGDGLLLVWPRR